MADLTLAQATAKGWVVERGPAAASPTGGPCVFRKEFVLSGATVSGRVPVTVGYHIGTGAQAQNDIKVVHEFRHRPEPPRYFGQCVVCDTWGEMPSKEAVICSLCGDQEER